MAHSRVALAVALYFAKVDDEEACPYRRNAENLIGAQQVAAAVALYFPKVDAELAEDDEEACR